MRSTLRLPLLVVAACATAALAACGADAGAGTGAATDPTYATNPDTPMDAKPTPSADTGGDTGGGANGGGDNGGGTTQEPTGPRIVSFKVTKKPSCPQGTTANLIPAQPVELSWKVTGTDKVTLSVDGPGIYKEYDAEGSDTLTFPCGGEDGGTVKHTYTLRTVGGGDVQERTVSATAIFHIIQDVSVETTEEEPTRLETELPIEETGTESE